MNAAEKSPNAFRTIGEVSADLAIPQHILRFWESKFPQLRPVKRSGNRRYYRPEDVVLVKRINRLLNSEGYTIAGVQRLLKQPEHAANGAAAAPDPHTVVASEDAAVAAVTSLSGDSRFDRAALRAIRDMLADGLARTPA